MCTKVMWISSQVTPLQNLAFVTTPSWPLQAIHCVACIIKHHGLHEIRPCDSNTDATPRPDDKHCRVMLHHFRCLSSQTGRQVKGIQMQWHSLCDRQLQFRGLALCAQEGCPCMGQCSQACFSCMRKMLMDDFPKFSLKSLKQVLPRSCCCTMCLVEMCLYYLGFVSSIWSRLPHAFESFEAIETIAE